MKTEMNKKIKMKMKGNFSRGKKLKKKQKM
jgi:hypothetical protein